MESNSGTMTFCAGSLLIAAALSLSACGTSVKPAASATLKTPTSGRISPRRPSGSSLPAGAIVLGDQDCGALRAPADGHYEVMASSLHTCTVAMEFVSRVALGAKHPTARGFKCSLVADRGAEKPIRVGICRGSPGQQFSWFWGAKGT